jgi:RHS repeat-associated protein
MCPTSGTRKEVWKQANGQSYMYDGRGNRTEKAGLKFYWYGLGSEVLDESDTSGNITDEYVYFGSERIAHLSQPSGTVYYYQADFLGTARALVQAGQTSPCFDADFYPFGGERDYIDTCSQNYKFQGKERDPESGNDDFGARYYSSVQGRWLSPDWSAVPAPVPFANLTNPQTLNLYAMVRDNPESFTDLDGHLLSAAPSGELDPSFWFDYTYTSQDAIYVPPSLVSQTDQSGYYASTASDGSSGDSSSNTASPQDSSSNSGQQAQNQGQGQGDSVTVLYYSGQNAMNPFGHTAISVDGDKPVGLEPKNNIRTKILGILEGIVTGVPFGHTSGEVATVASGRKANETATIKVRQEQAGRIREFVRQESGRRDQTYGVAGHNCSQFVEAALKAGGVTNVPNVVAPKDLVNQLIKNGASAGP